jgi:ribosomal protein L11 methyltransferase
VLAIVVSTSADEVELASDALWMLGVVAIEERAVGGTVELWSSLGEDVDTITNAASRRLDQWPWRLVEVDETIAESWRDHAAPVYVEADLVVCPAWVPFTAAAGVTVVRIEPGSTFGIGDHPTTMLSIRALRAALFDGATVLDVGCGSGVLAVGACALGASQTVAIDISPAAVPATQSNAAANGVADRVHVSTTPLAEVDGLFDIVVANILAPTLIELADDLRRVVAPGGQLIVSGLLADRHDHVEAALHPFRRTDRQILDGWAALSFSHPLSNADTSSTSSAGR